MQSDRLLALLLLLQSRGRISAADLAAELEVSKRTIYRDIDALSAAGIPVYAERGRNGGAALLPGYRADVTGLTGDEARALFAFGGRGAPLGLESDLRSALRKLLAALPERQRPGALHAQQRFLVERHGWHQQAPDDAAGTAASAAVREAIWSDRQVRVRYRAADAPAAREQVLDPYGLVVKGGVPYLIAAVGGEPRVYRVDRIEEAEVLGEPSARPRDLDLDALWRELRERFERRTEEYRVRARVRTAILPLFRRMTARAIRDLSIEASTSVDGDGDGHGDGENWTTISGTYPAEGAAVASLLSFGASVEALEPPALRDALCRSAEAVSALYTS